MQWDYVTVGVVGLRKYELTRNFITNSILLHAWVKVDADCQWLAINESQILCLAAEGWIDSKSDICKQRPSVL